MAKTEHTPLRDDALEEMFRAARAEAPEPSDSLMARIMADAEAEIAARAEAAHPVRTPRPGLWAALVAAIGGWPALASMATAAVAGVWLGFGATEGVDALAGGILIGDTGTATVSYEFEDLLPGYEGFAALETETD